LSRLQKTIAREAVLEGTGIHTGKKCTLRLLPAPADTGVIFVRMDLPQKPRVPAKFASLVPTNRRTALASDSVRVETVEHLLASFFVLGLDNCVVEIDTTELPALDGSGLLYYNLLRNTGLRELEAPGKEIVVRAPVEVKNERASIKVTPGEGFSVSYRLSYPQAGVEQEVDFHIDPETFAGEIAPARTFCLEEEIEQLRAAGFGKGANEENTVVLSPRGPRTKLRLADEPARHKVLDLLGDLFFLGGCLTGRIQCDRSGHLLNRELVEALLAQE
jgi:UDP-3-O-acyl N-acetylglucosamine deacetylase